MVYRFQLKETYRVTETIEVSVEAKTKTEALDKINAEQYKQRVSTKFERLDGIEDFSVREIIKKKLNDKPKKNT